ncbi:MAG: NAD(P)/FAD-dependent oxidoreductase [Paludibacteraceae bacterium]|nr:NAD(P)/FAD-dependent oxidoreductase [Paludibacteraceae bacterium]
MKNGGYIVEKKKKIIVIGGGVSGMSVGIYAQMNGFESQIIEKHSIAGGICTAWHRKGYRFDYSIQWLVGTREGAFHDTMCETNILNDQVQVINAEIHNRNIAKDGTNLVIYTDLERWKKHLLSISPIDGKAINKLARDIRRASHLHPFDIAPALRTPFQYFKAFFRCFPSLYIAIRHRGKDFTQYIKSLNIKSDILKEKLLNIYGEGDYACYAFLLIMGWYFRKNAGYPIGGSLAVAERMKSKYESLGGEFLFKKEVEEIIVENGSARGVRLTDGSVLEADYVVSAADGYTTLYKLLKGKFRSPMIDRVYANWKLFTSIVQVSFGINQELKTDYNIQVVQACGDKIGSTELKHNYRILNYNFDPTMAPEGKSCIIIRYDSPYSIWEKMSKEEYGEEKKKIEEDAIKILEKHYPGSSQHIEACDVATPLTTIRYTGAWKGSYEGFIPTSKNVIQQLDQKIPNLDHFYLAGQWLFPGGGIPPSVHSGKWALQLICRDEKKKFVSKPV